MSWIAAAIVGGSVVGAVASGSAASKSANAIQNGQDQATAESARQFDLVRADTANQRATGDSALERLKAIFLNGNLSDTIKTDPSYQFNQEQGQQAIDHSLVARGKALSGQGVKEGVRFASGLASGTTNDIYQRLAGLAGIGTQGINTSAQAGAQSANNITQAAVTGAQGRASSYMTGAAGINNSLQGGLSNFLLNKYLGG